MSQHYFKTYGIWIIFISALIEGLLILGQYFPGGFIIFLGVIAAGKDAFLATEVVLAVSMAFFISYYINYLIGKYGFYKLFLKFGLKDSLRNARRRLLKHGPNAILFSYWEPTLSTITATASGILQLPTKTFLWYSFLGIVIWNSFWGVVVFSMGERALTLMGLTWVLIICFLWIVIILVKKYIIDSYTKQRLR